MRNHLLTAIVLTAMVLGTAPAATALTEAKSRFGLGFDAGLFEPTQSKDSYELIYDEPGPMIGLNAYWKHRLGFAVELGVSGFYKEGESVRRTPEGNLVKSGKARTLLIAPVQLTLKWVFFNGRKVSPFVGIGAGAWYLSEKKSELDERTTSTTPGYHALAGLELFSNERTSFSMQAEYSTVPDAIGTNRQSTSGHLDETDIGGLRIALRVHFGL